MMKSFGTLQPFLSSVTLQKTSSCLLYVS